MNGLRELAELQARVDELDEDVAVLGSFMADLNSGDLVLSGAQEPPSPPPPPREPVSTGGGGGDPEPAEPLFGSLLEFVVEHFTPVYARATSPTVRWCASWWDHAEALQRLEALWRTWELYRLEPRLGIASWLRDYLDPQLRELTSATGPFASCTPDRHCPVKALLTNQPPEAYLQALCG